LKNVFSNCSSLISLPDISKWSIFNPNINIPSLLSIYNYENEHEYDIQKNFKSYLYLKNINFYLLKSDSINAKELKENLLNIAYSMNGLFAGCSSLKELPDISIWNLSNAKDISSLFYGCSSLKKLPDISKWNTDSITNLNNIFKNCSSLTFIPDISKWKLNNRIKINNIFSGCYSLLSIPDISKWNINIPEELKISSLNPIYIKEKKNNKEKDSSSLNESSSSKDNNDINSFKNNNIPDFSKIYELNNY